MLLRQSHWVSIPLIVCVLLLMLNPNTANAVTPEGPRLAFLQWGPGVNSISLNTMSHSGTDRRTLYRGSRRDFPRLLPFEPLAWLPDGSGVVFVGLTGHLYFDTRIFIVDVDGTGGPPRSIVGTDGGRVPVLSPDGKTLAFARRRERTRVEHPRRGETREFVEFAVSTWVMDISSGFPRRLTRWRFGVEHYPSAFSPDGDDLVVTRILNDGPPSLVALDLTGGVSGLIHRGAASAAFSPDGTRIAYLGVGRKYRERHKDGGVTTARTVDLYVSRADGSGSLRLTHSPRAFETAASWDPSGSRLAFAQFESDDSLFEPGGNALIQVNPDGTCKTKVLSLGRATLFEPAWQPGPGREAGRIAC